MNVYISAYEKELLALALAIQHWRPYLWGRRFRVWTDHKSLEFLLEQHITTEMQQRWIIRLMGYYFIIEYKQGKNNLVADGLSRKGEMPLIYMLILPSPSWWSVVEELHETHEEIKALKQRVEKRELAGQWSIQRGLLFFKNRAYLP